MRYLSHQLASSKSGSWLRTHGIAVAFFLVIVSIISFNTYIPGTVLSGWDNLHPEFNFRLNISRSFSASWQEYQGLGLLGGMSHAADISRQLILWVWSLVIPMHLLRYVWTMAMVLTGGLGAYFLIFYLLALMNRSKTTVSEQLSATAGGVFYIFNLATVQNFYVPYESFSSFYGFIPWLLLMSLRFLHRPTLRSAAAFFLVSILATSAFYVQTLFVVYMLVLAFFGVGHWLANGKEGLKNLIVLGFLLFSANAFWLLPSLHFTITNSDVNVNAKINVLSTLESQLLNKTTGTLNDIALLRGYWFNYTDFVPETGHVYLLEFWRNHTATIWMTVGGMALFIAATSGLLTKALRERTILAWTVVGLLLFTILMMSAGNGPLGWPFRTLSELVPLFGQMFRTAFTKWSVVTSLIYAIGWGFFISLVLATFRHTVKKAIQFKHLVALVGISLPIVLYYPLLTGQGIYSHVQVQPPAAYSAMYELFQTLPKQTRIAVLPAQHHWSWNFYSWGYRGSGFLWYGIEQPILDRAFDVWSPYNETFYHQLSTAIDQNNPDALNAVLAKYHVTYLILDESIVTNDPHSQLLNYPKLRQLLTESDSTQIWNQEFLSVYQVSDEIAISQQFVSVPSTLTKVNGSSILTRLDPIHMAAPHTIESATSENTWIFPFVFLTQENKQPVTYTDDRPIFTASDVFPAQPTILTLPALENLHSYFIPLTIKHTGAELQLTLNYPLVVTVNDQIVEIPSLDVQRIKLSEPNQPVLVAHGQQSLEIKPDDEASVTIQATAFAPLTWRIVPLTQIQQSGQEEFVIADTVQTATLSAQAWSTFSSPQRIQLENQIQQLSVKGVEPAHVLDTKTYSSFTACDVFKRGQTDRNIDQTITYTADQFGAGCSSYQLEGLPTNLALIVRWIGDNSEGRGLKFYADNTTTRKPNLETLLPQGTYDQSYGLLSWPSEASSPYVLQWQTKSFGQPTTNHVSQVSVYPFPIELATGIYIQPQQETTALNQLNLETTQKIGTALYIQKVQASQDGVLVLSQAFDPGWVAFSWPPEKFLDHAKYNQWANGWTVPQGTQTVIVAYWPQLLNSFGYVLIISVTLYGAVAFLKQSRRRTAPTPRAS